MLKIVCLTPNREDVFRFWVQVPEPPEKHLGFIRKSVEKYCGETPCNVTRVTKFTYRITMTVDNMVPTTESQVIRLAMEDYNQ